jgi:hypothetical protein
MSAVVPVQYLADMVVLITDQMTGEPAPAVMPQGTSWRR